MRHGPSAFSHRDTAPAPSSCQTGKVGYRKLRQAKREADRLARLANPKRRTHLRIYRCVYCPNWHLTSQPVLPEHVLKRPPPLKDAA